MRLELVILSVLSICSVLNAAVVFLVYRKLSQSEESNMARFHINEEDTHLDFKIFMVTSILFFISTSTWMFAEMLGNIPVQNFGRGMAVISSFIPLAIFYRWWRRFQ